MDYNRNNEQSGVIHTSNKAPLGFEIKPLKNCFYFSADYEIIELNLDELDSIMIHENEYKDGLLVEITSMDGILESFDFDSIFIEYCTTNGAVLDKIISGIKLMLGKLFNLKK